MNNLIKSTRLKPVTLKRTAAPLKLHRIDRTTCFITGPKLKPGDLPTDPYSESSSPWNASPAGKQCGHCDSEDGDDLHSIHKRLN